MNKEVKYENLIQHAAALADVLIRKGYDNDFLFRPSDMRAALAYGMKGLAVIWKFSEVKEIPKLTLRTRTYEDRKGNDITCTFEIDYDLKKGFQIREMKILHQNAKGLAVDTNIIKTNNHEDLLSRKQANQSVTPKSIWEKVVQKRGFKY